MIEKTIHKTYICEWQWPTIMSQVVFWIIIVGFQICINDWISAYTNKFNSKFLWLYEMYLQVCITKYFLYKMMQNVYFFHILQTTFTATTAAPFHSGSPWWWRPSCCRQQVGPTVLAKSRRSKLSPHIFPVNWPHGEIHRPDCKQWECVHLDHDCKE